MGTLVPGRQAMVKAKRELSSLVERHLVLVFTAKLRKSTDSLVDPFVTVDLLSTRGFGSW